LLELSRKYLCAIAVVGISSCVLLPTTDGQELDCSVRLDYSNISGSDYSYLDDLRNRIDEYVNRQFWTEDRFREVERIDCSLDINILEAITLTTYRANLTVASRRPIYGSTQTTKILLVADEEWIFDYTQGSSLISNRDIYNPLSTLIDYYIYLILGYDYDTFSEYGGTPHFENARIASDLARNANGSGWQKLGGDRGRADIIEEILDPRNRELRRTYYFYHFGGLDHFVSQTEEARENILTALVSLQTLFDSSVRSYVMDLFFSAKYKEISEIFRDSSQGGAVYDILAEMDPAHVVDYNILIQ